LERHEIRLCYNCGSDRTYFNKRTNSFMWYKHEDGFLCNKYNNNLIINPKHHPRRLGWTPGKRQILLKDNPRTGVCSLCRKQGKTHLHHINYHENDPLKDTVELCISCHNKERSNWLVMNTRSI
jgi:hypothetical protein